MEGDGSEALGSGIVGPAAEINREGNDPEDIIRVAPPIGNNIPVPSDPSNKPGLEHQIIRPLELAQSSSSGHPTQSGTSKARTLSSRSLDLLREKQEPSKVSKSRKSGNNTNSRSSGGTGQRFTFGADGVSQEDLFALLMFRCKQDKDKEETKAENYQKELTAADNTFLDLQDEIDRLRAKNKDQGSCLTSYKADLKMYKSNLEKCKETLKRHQAFVKGLANDYNNLRDSANELKRQLKAAKAERDEVGEYVAESRKLLEQARGFQAVELEAVVQDSNHQITELEKSIHSKDSQIAELKQKIREHDVQSQDQDKLIEHERTRSDDLEHAISEVSETQDKIVRILETNQVSLTEKLESALVRSLESGDALISSSPKMSTSALDYVVTCLEELKERPVLDPSDLGRLKQAALHNFER